MLTTIITHELSEHALVIFFFLREESNGYDVYRGGRHGYELGSVDTLLISWFRKNSFDCNWYVLRLKCFWPCFQQLE